MFKVLAKRISQSIAAAAAVTFIGLAAAPAASQVLPEMTTSVWCDKAEQVESVARAHFGDGVAIEAAMQRTNEAAKDAGACAVGTVVVLDTGKSKRFVTANQMLAIGEFLVIGVVKNGQLVPIEPVTWYAARVVAKLDVM